MTRYAPQVRVSFPPSRPLEGVTVVDLTRVLAGPYCTMILADLGARVVKIERPGVGDDSRQIGPFVCESGRPTSAYFASVNRNKQSIVLDLRDPADLAILHQLLRQADVLVENFSPGTMDRLGLGWTALHEQYPALVMASISGFGQTGPLRSNPAYDVIVQAMSGLMSITGQQGGAPVRTGNSIADLAAGLFTAVGVQAALLARSTSGHGAHVDVAMLDCQVALLENALARYQASGIVPGPLGSHHPSIAPFGAFRAPDGWLAIAAGNDGVFQALCAVLGVESLASDPRYATNDKRSANVDALNRELETALGGAPRSVWLPRLAAAHVPSAPLNDISEVMRDPQLHARQMLIDLALASGPESQASLVFAGNPIKIGSGATGYRPAPKLDEHRTVILEELARREREDSLAKEPRALLLRRIHWRILPLLVICYLLAQLDRLNIGFAQFGLRTAIGLNDLSYGAAVAIFFAGYIVFEIPSNLCLRRFGARRTFSVLLCGWGLTTMATMWVRDISAFNVSRFLLGAFEAGFFPGVMLYLTYWYPPQRRASVLSIFVSALAISGMVVGPLSGWIVEHLDGAGRFAGWQWLFFLEGLPAVVCGLLIFRVLADTPADAHWLTPHERSLVERNAAGATSQKTPMSVGKLLVDPMTYLLSAVFFGGVGALYGINFWSPVVIKGFGFESPTTIGLVSALPYLTSLVAMVFWGRHSDRSRERMWHFILPSLTAAAALSAIPCFEHGVVIRVVLLALATAGILSSMPIFWSIAQNYYGSRTAPVGLAIVNSFGVLAGAVVPYAVGWLKSTTGGMGYSLFLISALLVASAAMLSLAHVRITSITRT